MLFHSLFSIHTFNSLSKPNSIDMRINVIPSSPEIFILEVSADDEVCSVLLSLSENLGKKVLNQLCRPRSVQPQRFVR